MRILVACEESQEVCKAFRKKGHEAYSCDVQQCSGGFPEWHIRGDVIPLIDGNCTFFTGDGSLHAIHGQWDMIIAFPPCTYLTNTGNRWFDEKKYGKKASERKIKRAIASELFIKIASAKCEKIAIENPIGYMNTHYRSPDQIIHPYYFAEYDGDENCERKSTCLWLKGLPKLRYTIRYTPRIVKYKNNKGTDSYWHVKTINMPKDLRTKMRSKTFPGIAKAMAEQWG